MSDYGNYVHPYLPASIKTHNVCIHCHRSSLQHSSYYYGRWLISSSALKPPSTSSSGMIYCVFVEYKSWRTHQLGQTKDVSVYRLIYKQTVAEKILQSYKERRRR